MNRPARVGICVGGLLVALVIGGCGGTGMPNDAYRHQEEARLNKPLPSPTELPPGLGPDLPADPPQANASEP